MVKFIGAVFLALAGWAAGAAVCQRMTLHKKALGEILTLLRQTEEEIRFRHGNLTQFVIQQRERGGYTTLVLPKDGWLQTIAPPRYLRPEEQALFRRCFARIGYGTAAQESERLQLFIRQFEGFYDIAAQHEGRALAIDRKVGLAIGTMCALVFM